LQRHFLLVAEPPRRDRPESWPVIKLAAAQITKRPVAQTGLFIINGALAARWPRAIQPILPSGFRRSNCPSQCRSLSYEK
jgi:hypothetical protein